MADRLTPSAPARPAYIKRYNPSSKVARSSTVSGVGAVWPPCFIGRITQGPALGDGSADSAVWQDFADPRMESHQELGCVRLEDKGSAKNSAAVTVEMAVMRKADYHVIKRTNIKLVGVIREKLSS
jgi:hypothetical protein